MVPSAGDTQCTFCNIIAGKMSATIHYEDDEVIVIDNILNWAPVMLLVMPKRHLTQKQLWSDQVMVKLGRIAMEMGDRLCPRGYRLLSNFGHDAMQSQPHGHIHLLGGEHLGPYA